MPTAEARIETERPSRYLVQLCRHANAMSETEGHGHRTHAGSPRPDVRAEWSETRGLIRFDPWGECTIEATATTLVLRIEAAGEDGLRRIQEVVTADLGRFGRRDRLAVSWHEAESSDPHGDVPGRSLSGDS